MLGCDSLASQPDLALVHLGTNDLSKRLVKQVMVL